MIPSKRMFLSFAALLLLNLMANAADGFGNSRSPMAMKFAGYISNATQTVTLGSTPVMLQASEPIGSCTGGFTYQWQQSTDSITFTNISGATGVNYQPGTITQKMYYRRMAICGSETGYTNVASVTVVLDGGCISSKKQYLLFGHIPATITATPALYGLFPGVYKYQWQSSIDNISFIDIPGATSQDLSFSSAPAQSTWYQRKTTSGTVSTVTSGSVKVVMASVLYYNAATSGSFVPDNCPAGARSAAITYTVPANTYVSEVSQADVDAQTQSDINANGQNYANSNAQCLWYNVARSATFTKNNCATGGTGSSVTYNVAANVYSSATSQADADTKAQNDINTNGQTYANNNGYCTWMNAIQSGTFTRNNCQSGATPTSVVYSVPAATYSSTVSQADADQKAVNDVNANGQNYANNNAVCTNIFITLRNNGGSPGTFGITVKSTSGTILYSHTVSDLPFSVAVPAQNYIIEMTSMNPMYAIIGGSEKYTYNTTASWNTGNVVNIQVSQSALYRNVAKSGAFTRNNCGSGYTGTTVTYTVPAGTYTSTISQADADQQAQNDVNANGQNYANANGSCTLVQMVTVTLQMGYTTTGYPYPVTVDFIQNGSTKYTGTFPNSKNGSGTISVQAGDYSLRFTVPSSYANAPISFSLNPGSYVWSHGMNSNTTVVTTGTVTLSYGTAYTIRVTAGIE